MKSNHSLFLKECIEERLKGTLGECYIALEGKHLSGTDLVTIGYRCNSKVTLLFIMSKNNGSPRKGLPYKIKFTDTGSNVHVRLVDIPSVVSNFFQDSSVVDKHN